jgi:drug/metabolite transporter (DMT)-like permease
MGKINLSDLKKLESRSALALGITLILNASSYPGIRAALSYYHPVHLILLRFLTASSFLLIYAIITKMRLPDRKDIPGILALGFIGLSMNQLFISYGEVNVTAGVASLLVSSSPVFSAIFASFLLNEKLEKIGWIGIATSFFGVSLVALGSGGGFQFHPGEILIIAAAVTNGIFYVYQKPYFKKYTTQEFPTYAIWAGTLFLLIFLPNLITDIKNAPISATASVMYLGIFPLALSNFTWSYTLSKMPVPIAASFLSTLPVFSIIISFFWLGEFPALVALVGGAFAILGTILVDTEGRYPHSKH